MTKPVAYILYAPGINCHHETAYAFELAGAESRILNVSELLSGGRRMSDGNLLAIPGGFSYGDHLGAGRVLASDLLNQFRDQLLELRQRRIPILGICNGFQVLVECGLLPGSQLLGERTAVLDRNQSGRFEHRGLTRLSLREPAGVESVWTKGLAYHSGPVPVAHAQGRLVLAPGVECNIIAVYGSKRIVAVYPDTPSGSPIAGICDQTGLIAGLMPHPERRVDELHGGDFGLRIFKAGVEAVK